MTPQELIQMGFHIFPLQAGSKRPFAGSWYDQTVSTLEGVSTAEAQYPGCNWAVNTGHSGLLVVDLDVDVDKGKDGVSAWSERTVLQGHGYEETLCVRTPRGGFHIYFKGVSSNSASKIGKDIDVRSAGGYVVAPGSSLPNGAYEVVTAKPIAAAPHWLVQAAGLPIDREGREDSIEELDLPGSIQAAANLLASSEGAVEGSGTGNVDTFKLACRAKDLGVSEHMCLDLMMEYWADRCFPAFMRDDLSRLVTNAYTYGVFGVGSATAEAAFSDHVTPPEYTYDAQYQNSIAEMIRKPTAMLDPEFLDATDIVEADIPKRPWVLGRRYIRNFVTQIIAPGGVGKSMLSIADALSIATGTGITGETVHEIGRVWIHNAEDPLDELKMRVAAAMKYHELTPAKGSLILTSGRVTKLVVAHVVDGVAAKHESNIKRLIEEILNRGITVLIGDPLIRLHAVKENSNEDMDVVMEALQDVAEATGCCICIIHHTRKLNGKSGAGDMDAARGASSVVSAARIQYTLTTMAEKEAEAYGIAEDRRRWYVELMDAKANMAPPHDERVWLEKKSVELSNGEHVGTFDPADLRKVEKIDPKWEENEFIAAVASRDFDDRMVRPIKVLVDAVFADPDAEEVMKASPVTINNRLMKMTDSILTASGTKALTLTHESQNVPGKGSHGFYIEVL